MDETEQFEEGYIKAITKGLQSNGYTTKQLNIENSIEILKKEP